MAYKQPRIIASIPRKKVQPEVQIITKKNNWQDYLKLSPVLYALIVILSFIKLYIYYLFFNINISEFLSITEILIAFLDDMVYYVGILIFQLVFTYWLDEAGKSDYIKRASLSKEEREKIYTSERKFGSWMSRGAIFLFYGLLTLFVIESYLTDWNEFIQNLMLVGFATSLLLIALFAGGKTAKKISKSTYIRTLIMFFMYLTVISIYFPISNALRVKTNSKAHFSEITYKEEIVKSDSTQFFIGKSDNYIFYYNKEKRQTTAFPLKDVGYIK